MTPNPNGVWSYGWFNRDKFSLYENVVEGAWSGPLKSSYGNFPVIWKNMGTPKCGVNTNQVSLHPGPDGEASVVRWTAPIGFRGNILVNGKFHPGDANNKIKIAISKNGKLNAPLWSGVDSGEFNLKVAVVPRDTIEFFAYGSYGEGNTPLEANIRP